MSYCIPDKGFCFLFQGLSIIPILHAGIGYIQHKYQKSKKYLLKKTQEYKTKRKQFKQDQKELLINWLTITFKMCIVSILITSSFLQIILHLIHHKLYKVIDIIEVILIFQYLLQLFMIYYDATHYGYQTLMTKINLVLSLICYSTYIGLIYNLQFNYDGSIIEKTDLCWILLMVRGGIKLLLCIGVLMGGQDFTLITTILLEYEYKEFGSIANSDPYGSEKVVEDHKISIFTFTGEQKQDLSQSLLNKEEDKITNVSVKDYKESQKYEKKTIIYLVEYRFCKQDRQVYRSFREFISFHSDLTQEFQNDFLPEFPERKEQGQLSHNDVEERRNLLHTFMVEIARRFNQNSQLRKFLNIKNDQPQYLPIYPPLVPIIKKVRVKISSSSRYNPSKTTSLIPETIFEDGLNEDDSIDDMKRRPKSQGSQIFIKAEQFVFKSKYTLDYEPPQFGEEEDYQPDQRQEEEKTPGQSCEKILD